MFIDGELRQVIDSNETYTIDGNSNDQVTECGPNTIMTDLGDFYSGVVNDGEVLLGYISKMKFFNYALTVDHAKMVYKTGPVHQSILAKLGLPLYGVRNPFYRIDSDDTEKDDDDSSN